MMTFGVNELLIMMTQLPTTEKLSMMTNSLTLHYV